MMTSKEIRRTEFSKGKFGYQTEEVEAFLKRVEADYRQMEEQLADANNKVQLLADKVREYKEEEDDLKNALLVAQKQARQILDDAKEKAAKIEEDAKSSVTSVKSAAVEEQEKQLTDISAKLDKENRVLVETQRQVAGFKKSLFDMYKQHLELISNLPDTIDEDDTAEEEDAEEETAAPVAAETAEAAAPAEKAEENAAAQQTISHTAEFDARYNTLQFGNRRDEKKKRR